jgi:hypothetical protein
MLSSFGSKEVLTEWYDRNMKRIIVKNVEVK